jgi:hypothetical protein
VVAEVQDKFLKELVVVVQVVCAQQSPQLVVVVV